MTQPQVTDAMIEAAKENLRNVMKGHADYDSRMCCNGHECGCQGTSVFEAIQHYFDVNIKRAVQAALAHQDGEVVGFDARDRAILDNHFELAVALGDQDTPPAYERMVAHCKRLEASNPPAQEGRKKTFQVDHAAGTLCPTTAQGDLVEKLQSIIRLLRATDALQANGFACDAVALAREVITALRADHGELRDQVIEECAKVAEQYVTQAQSDDQHDRVHQATGIVKDIRALKGSKT